MPQQVSGKPTKKVIAQSIAGFVIGFGTPYLQDIGASAEDIMHATALIESLLFGVVGFVLSFVSGYFKSPGAADGVVN